MVSMQPQRSQNPSWTGDAPVPVKQRTGTVRGWVPVATPLGKALRRGVYSPGLPMCFLEMETPLYLSVYCDGKEALPGACPEFNDKRVSDTP